MVAAVYLTPNPTLTEGGFGSVAIGTASTMTIAGGAAALGLGKFNLNIGKNNLSLSGLTFKGG